MKIYKHNLYDDKILLMYPSGVNKDKFLGVAYFYSEFDKKWKRAGIGSGLPCYAKEHLDGMECIGDTDVDWDFYIDSWGIDASYLIKKGKQ